MANIRSSVDNSPPKARPPRPPAFTARREAQAKAAVNDIKMIGNIAREMARPPSLSVLERKGPTSLNTNRRRKELLRIDQENEKLLKRLEGQKSAYSKSAHARSYQQSREHVALASQKKEGSRSASEPHSLPPLQRNGSSLSPVGNAVVLLQKRMLL